MLGRLRFFGKKVYPHIRRATAPERKEVSIHDSVFQPAHQRLVAGQHLCTDRTGLQHGVRHHPAAELCPWRCHYGWCVHVLVRDESAGPWPGHCCVRHHHHLHAAGRCDREDRLHPAAQRTPYLPADHGNRRVLLPGVHCRADPWFRCKGHSGLLHQPDLPHRLCAAGPHLCHHPAGHGAVHAGAYLPCAEDQARQGHACRV